MLERIRNRTSGKKLCIFSLLFAAVFLPMNAYVSAFQEEAGVTLMDFRFGGYSAETAEEILTALGAAGRRTYLHLLSLDCGMVILYLLLLTSLIGWIEKRFEKRAGDMICFFCCRFLACSRTGQKTSVPGSCFLVIHMFPAPPSLWRAYAPP